MSNLSNWKIECRKNFEAFGFTVNVDVFKRLGYYVFYNREKSANAQIYWPDNDTVLVSKIKLPHPIGVSESKEFPMYDFGKMRDYILE